MAVLDPEGAHARAIRSLADLSGLSVLEIGCGDGRLTFELAGEARSWLGVDPKPTSIDAARDRLPPELVGTVRFAVAGGAEVEADPSEFDLVLFSWSL
jgi:ubiquinone/menaquinone biosynthesis C-methylase UbiE